MKELITVIIPVYNTELYLEECVQSVLQQTYDNLEIILINDGSKDKSGEICDNFQKADNRIIVIHQKNQGVSSARNKGLDISKGKYVVFVDSDDFVESDYIQKLYEQILNYDIAVCGIGRFIQDEKKENLIREQELSQSELISQTLGNNYVGGFPVNKIFRKEIIDLHNIRFNETIHIGEDMLWILSYLNYCQKGFYISKTLYYYRLNENSVLQSSIRQQKFNKKNLEILYVSDLLRNIIYSSDDLIEKALGYRYIRSDMRLLFNMVSCNYRDKKVFRIIKNHIRKYLKQYLKYNNSTKLEKIVAIGMRISPELIYNLGIIGYIFVDKHLKKYLN